MLISIVVKQIFVILQSKTNLIRFIWFHCFFLSFWQNIDERRIYLRSTFWQKRTKNTQNSHWIDLSLHFLRSKIKRIICQLVFTILLLKRYLFVQKLEPDHQSITNHPFRGGLNLFCERNIFYNIPRRIDDSPYDFDVNRSRVLLWIQHRSDSKSEKGNLFLMGFSGLMSDQPFLKTAAFDSG